MADVTFSDSVSAVSKKKKCRMELEIRLLIPPPSYFFLKLPTHYD
jgi:hypothetical protein